MHKKYQKVKQFLLYLILLNSITYVGARCLWYLTGGVAAELKVVRAVGDSGIMNYFIAGNVNQPDTAFKFLEDKVNGGITYVIYPRARGCSMCQIANQVLADAKQQNCKVRTFGISLGDYVSRCVEAELPNAETVAINPAPTPAVLKPYANAGLKVVTPIMEMLTVPLGWVSYIPCIRGFSPAFLADQWRDLAYRNDAPHATAKTIGVICSKNDEFLQNDVIAEYFQGVPIVMIDSSHGNTQGSPEAYAAVLDLLMLKA